MTTHLLFVCSGNICRSPMALGIAQRIARDNQLDVAVDSAGTLMIYGRPADPHAVAVCKDIGVDISRHESKGITEALCDWADHILVMELKHSAHIQHHYSTHSTKVIHLGHLIGQMEIPDPIGRWRRTFKKNRGLVETAVEQLMKRFDTR